MKKLFTLLTMLVIGIGSTWADVTDLPEITTDENNPKLYVVKNVRSSKYVAYRGDSEQIRQIDNISSATLWYFTAGGSESTAEQLCVKMRSYFADGKAVSSVSSFTADGTNIAIRAHKNSNGVLIDVYNYAYGEGYVTAFNDSGSNGMQIGLWTPEDAGGSFVIEPVDGDLLETLRTQYSDKVDGCETLTAIFSSSDCATAKTAITNATTGLEIIEAYETLIATANDKLISLKSHDAEKYVSFGSGIKATDSEGIIKIVSKHDLVAFQNPETNQYISCPLSQSSQFQASDTPDYFQFVFNGSYSGYVCLASSNARTGSGTLTMHDANNGSGNIVTWYSNTANSFFQPASKTLADFKTSIKSKLDAISGWQPIYAAADITTAKSDVDDAATTDAINTIYENAVKAANGKLLSIENYANAGKYMSINASNVTNRTYPTVIKLLVNEDLTYSLQGYLNFDGYYAEQLKNVDYTYVASSATAGKYRIGYSDTKGFLFYSTEHSGCLHYSNGNVVRWYDDADASYWTVADVSDAAYLGSYYNALLPYQANYGQYGYYKSGTMSKSYFDESIIGTSAGVLADLTTYAAYITTMKTAAKSAYDNITPVVPVAGDFLRIKASDANKTAYSLSESNLYLTSSNCASKTDRAGFAEGAATDNTTIFYYDGTNLTGFAKGLQPTGTGTYAQMSIGNVGATPTVIGFDALYGTEDHSYRVRFSGTQRALYTQRGGDGTETPYYYHSDAAGSGNTGDHYRYFLEKVTSLPVTFQAAGLGYATFHSPVAVKIPAESGVNAYVSRIDYSKTPATISMYRVEIAGDEEGDMIIPAETPVVLYKSSVTENTTVEFPIVTYTGEKYEGNGFYGTIAAKSMGSGNYYSLRAWTKTGDENPTKVGFYTKTSGTLAGFKAWIWDNSGSARNFTIEFDGDSDPTGIVEALGLENDNVEIYDLNGRKLASYKKGINIVNGKKVMVK